MTSRHYDNIIKVYKELILTNSVNNLKELIKEAILERDVCYIQGASTEDVNNYIIELKYIDRLAQDLFQ